MCRRRTAKKLAVMKRDNWICSKCKGWFPDTPEITAARATGGDMWNMVGNHMTVDHIKPKSQGGSYSYDNLRAMCYVCNNMRADEKQRSGMPGAKKTRRNRHLVAFPSLTE